MLENRHLLGPKPQWDHFDERPYFQGVFRRGGWMGGKQDSRYGGGGGRFKHAQNINVNRLLDKIGKTAQNWKIFKPQEIFLVNLLSPFAFLNHVSPLSKTDEVLGSELKKVFLIDDYSQFWTVGTGSKKLPQFGGRRWKIHSQVSHRLKTCNSEQFYWFCLECRFTLVILVCINRLSPPPSSNHALHLENRPKFRIKSKKSAPNQRLSQ